MSANNRRDTIRSNATVKFSLKTHGLRDFQNLYSENVGKGGVFVRCREPLPQGTKVRFEIICRDHGDPLIGEAEVMWIRQVNPEQPDQWPGMGMRFLSLSEQSVALLEALAQASIDSAMQDFEDKVEPTHAVAPAQIEASEEAALDLGEPLDLEQPLDLDEPLSLDEAIPEDDKTHVQGEPRIRSGNAELTESQNSVNTAVEASTTKDSDAMVALPTSYSVVDTVLGIDLGTSNSCVAIIKDGKPYVIPTEAQERTVPSVVAYLKTGEVIVGKTAKEQLVIEPKHTIYGAKRFIGRPFNSPVVKNLKDTFPYDLVPGEKGQVAIKIRDKIINLEEISSQVLAYLKMVAQSFIDLEVTKAIITVPAYYNDNQRQAVKEAGRMAGLDVQRIVNEPTAAALAFGFNRGFKTKILVYDLGGGTFDVSILELSGNSFSVMACGGNNFLGGEDFDNAITDHIVQTYERENKVTLSRSRIVRERIKQAAEFAKRTLSDAERTTINIPYLKTEDNQNLNMQIPIAREVINRITKHFVDRTLQICDEVMNGIGIKKSEINDIILVGGQTRMPLVRHSIHQYFGRPARYDLNPDEVVAMGAALLGAGLKQTESLKLRDTISITIGIALPGGRFKPVIKANSPVPIIKNYKIGTTKDGQDNFHIDVFQGESGLVHENEYLGTLLFSDLPVGKKGDVKLNIDFMITEECILKVVATHPESGRSEEALLVTYDTPPSLKEVVVNPGPAVKPII